MRIENSLSPLYRGTDFSTLAETFQTVWGGAPVSGKALPAHEAGQRGTPVSGKALPAHEGQRGTPVSGEALPAHEAISERGLGRSAF